MLSRARRADLHAINHFADFIKYRSATDDGADAMAGGLGNDTYVVGNLHQYISDSSGDDRAIVTVSFAKIPSSIEHVDYVQGALPLPYWISALLSDGGAIEIEAELERDPAAPSGFRWTCERSTALGCGCSELNGARSP